MAKTPAIRVARAGIIAAFKDIRGRAPPTLSLDRALREIGPDMRRMLEEDWDDDELTAAVLEADQRRLKEASETNNPSLEPLLSLTSESVKALISEMRRKEKN